jgi:hypothetical protein
VGALLQIAFCMLISVASVAALVIVWQDDHSKVLEPR